MRRIFPTSILAILVCAAIAGPVAFAQQSGVAPPASSDAAAPPAAKPTAPATPASGSPAPVAAAVAKAPAPPATPQTEALQLYRTGKFDAAVEAYNKLAASDPGTAYAGLTRVYLRQRKVVEAYTAVNKAVDLAPNSPDVRVALAEVYYRQGKII
ncbi:MAG: tetratricopeptide repeat protein, partial [Candidatus Acidiferrales bacterium]